MDKLRALQYFTASADGASFSSAARRLDVSAAAVAKLVAALEAGLGVRLFDRHAHGLMLTAAGHAYLDACQPALAQLALADEQASAATAGVRGTIVVGVQPVLAQLCLTPALPRFLLRYPEVQVDLRYFMRPDEQQVRGVDLMLVLGWPKADELVQRQLGAVSYAVCASPVYWAAHGTPTHPRELAGHNCLCARSSQSASVMDLWKFRRGDEDVEVTVRGNLLVDNAHRDAMRSLLLAGAGVGRLLEWDLRPETLAGAGALVPALQDWASPEVPPVMLMHPPSVRRLPRVRVFIDFLTQLFGDMEQQRAARLPASQRPRWVVAGRSRTSAVR